MMCHIHLVLLEVDSCSITSYCVVQEVVLALL
jgi:hypothetical protein